MRSRHSSRLFWFRRQEASKSCAERTNSVKTVSQIGLYENRAKNIIIRALGVYVWQTGFGNKRYTSRGRTRGEITRGPRYVRYAVSTTRSRTKSVRLNTVCKNARLIRTHDGDNARRHSHKIRPRTSIVLARSYLKRYNIITVYILSCAAVRVWKSMNEQANARVLPDENQLWTCRRRGCATAATASRRARVHRRRRPDDNNNWL